MGEGREASGYDHRGRIRGLKMEDRFCFTLADVGLAWASSQEGILGKPKKDTFLMLVLESLD